MITLSESTETAYNYFERTTLVKFHFSEIVKVTKSYYTYSPLSLIAEIGGYVGLFLGVSVNMVTNLLEFLVAKLGRLEGLINI